MYFGRKCQNNRLKFQILVTMFKTAANGAQLLSTFRTPLAHCAPRLKRSAIFPSSCTVIQHCTQRQTYTLQLNMSTLHIHYPPTSPCHYPLCLAPQQTSLPFIAPHAILRYHWKPCLCKMHKKRTVTLPHLFLHIQHRRYHFD